MFVRGQDVIDDITRLKKIVAAELQIIGADFDATTRLLEEVDLLEDRKTRTGRRVFHEKVERLDYLSNYERLGESARKSGTFKEGGMLCTHTRCSDRSPQKEESP